MLRPAQIRAFEAELDALAAEGVEVDAAVRERIRAHHEALLQHLSVSEGLAVTEAEEKLSLGMRLASFVGAVALSCAVFFLFYRVWGGFSVAEQVAVLVVMPCLLVGATHLLHRWEKTGYFASLAALAAFAAFILDLGALGEIFNLPPTPHAFLAWGAFGIVLGWAYALRLPHFGGLICLGLWCTAMPGWYFLEELPDLFARGESLLLAGGLFLGAAYYLRNRVAGWRTLDLRLVGMIGVFVGLFILSVDGGESWLPFDRHTIESLYQLVGFAVAGGIITWGIRARHSELANGGMIFLTVLCLVKAVNWWWEWLPRWLFFLVVAALAIGVMVALRQLKLVMARRMA